MLTDDTLIDDLRARLRAELSALEPPAELLGDLRERARTGRRGWTPHRAAPVAAHLGPALSVAATLAVLALAGAAVVLLRHSATGPTAGSGAGAGAAAPARFLILTATGNRTAVLDVRSSRTGRVLRRIARFVPPGPAGAFFDSGLAVSPGGREAFLGFPGGALERIDLATGARVTIASGALPAISPDGGRLAYATDFRGAAGPDRLAVRDLATGRTRSIDLQPVLTDKAALGNGAVAWLDARDVAVVPGLPFGIRHPQDPRVPARPHSCAAVPASAACLLLIHVPAADGALTVRPAGIPGVSRVVRALAPDTSHPGDLVIATEGRAGMILSRISLSAGRAGAIRLAAVRSASAMSFDASGLHVLYLKIRPAPAPGSQPSLWTATIEGDQLTGARRLLGDARLQEVAW